MGNFWGDFCFSQYSKTSPEWIPRNWEGLVSQHSHETVAGCPGAGVACCSDSSPQTLEPGRSARCTAETAGPAGTSSHPRIKNKKRGCFKEETSRETRETGETAKERTLLNALILTLKHICFSALEELENYSPCCLRSNHGYRQLWY